MNNLFRQNNPHKDDYCGNYLKAKIISWINLLFIILIMLIVLVFFLFFLDFNEKLLVDGVTISKSGESNILSPISGTVTRLIKQPKLVSKGDSLFRVSSLPLSNEIEVINEKKINTAQLQIENLKIKYVNDKAYLLGQETIIKDKITALENETNILRDNKQLLKEKLVLTQKNFSLYAKAVEKGAINKLSLYTKESEILDLKVQLNQLINLINKNQNLISELKIEFLHKPNQINALNYQFNKELNTLTNIITELDINQERVITSPIDGYVTSLSVKDDETVLAGDILAIVINPTDEIEVFLPVNGNIVGKIIYQADVRLNLPSFPYQDYGFLYGNFNYISERPILDYEFDKYKIPRLEGMNYFKVISSIDKKNSSFTAQEKLQIGMPVNAEIIIKRKSLFDRIISPIKKTSKNI